MPPLTGCTVLDFSTLLPGPLATLMLAEAGATIVKVEKPGGEAMRAFPPFFSGGSAPYALLNRGKTALALDLKSEDGRDQALRLMRSADVVVEQFRPGVMARLGLGYEAARAENPAIIYCSITGYGQSGPRAGEAGHDINYLANTGLLSLSWGVPDAPTLPPAQIADIAGGSLPAVVNILLALLRRERTGEGAYLDIAMSDAMFTFALFAQAVGAATGRCPGNREGLLAGGSPRYGLYVARCGTPIAVGALEDSFWSRLCDVLGLGPDERDDAADPRRARAAVTSAIKARSAAEWAPLLAAADCCATPLVPLEEALRDPHFRERGLFAYEVGDEDGYLPAAVMPIAGILRDPVRRKPAPRLDP